MDAIEETLRLGDQLRAIALMGLGYSEGKPYDADRYKQVMGVAAELFSLVDTRSALEIRQSVFHQLTHVTPLKDHSLLQPGMPQVFRPDHQDCRH